MISLTKNQFELYVPVAKQPDRVTDIFDSLEAQFASAYQYISEEYLGDDVTAAIDGGSAPTASLPDIIRACVCRRAFLMSIRSNDIVLTPTGFGIVSTDKVAPASKERVAALQKEIALSLRYSIDSLLGELANVDGWGASETALTAIPHVFFRYRYFPKYSTLSSIEGNINNPQLLAANSILKDHISSDFNDELLTAIRTASVTEEQMKVIELMRRFVGAYISDKIKEAKLAYAELIRLLDNNVETYTTYAASEAYELNHFENYENTKQDPCYFFG